MQFNTLIFLYLFLPLCIAFIFIVPRPLKNSALLLASLIFYAWGGPWFICILIASIAINYGIGLRIAPTLSGSQRGWLATGIGVNILLLIACKYSGFLAEQINACARLLGWRPLPLFKPLLPLGISYFTFKAIAYLLAVYRGEAKAQRNPVDLALYISIFPQIIAGPIDRYTALAPQIRARTVTFECFASGVQRFALGMAKKVIVSTPLAQVADNIFKTPAANLAPMLAWLGAGAFMLQIYYDFSGYSDMAIGIGRMLGFSFMENFNFPYISRSFRQFWQRWHISLSTWLRDYLFLPLAYSASRALPKDRYLGWRSENGIYVYATLITFILCGLWHGAAWNFIAWGALHGMLLSIERSRFGKWLERGFNPAAHLYFLFFSVMAFVIFRTPDLPSAAMYLKTMAGLSGHTVPWPVVLGYMDREFIIMAIIAIAGATPVLHWLRQKIVAITTGPRQPLAIVCFHAYHLATVLLPLTILCIATLYIVAKTNSPFLYFKF